MISRREFLGTSLGAGAALALTPELLRAFQQSGGKLIQRAIPSSGEMLPALGLSFSNHPACADHAALTAGPQGVCSTTAAESSTRCTAARQSEQFHITAATSSGFRTSSSGRRDGRPLANAAPQADASHESALEALFARFKVSKIDLVMLPAAADPAHLAALKEEKKEGRVRYIGVQTIVGEIVQPPPKLEAIMRNEPIDFIGIDYDVSNRLVEDKILPLAQERKIGVMAFFPSAIYGMSCTAARNSSARAGTRPLPEWAAEFDAKTWAQFFLKYVISHPAVTVARTGTTKPAHMLENIGGGIGRLPNEATRKRMAELVDALPPRRRRLPDRRQLPPGIALPVAVLDRYVGEYKAASGFTATFRRDGDKLFVKPGNNPEVPSSPGQRRASRIRGDRSSSSSSTPRAR